jgi:glycosyltransferase involved in cell wall biosynthesis
MMNLKGLSAKPHLAIYLPSLELGGVQSVFLSIAAGLSARGFKVSLLTHDAQGDRSAEFAQVCAIIDLGHIGRLKRVGALSAWIDKGRPDCVFTGMPSANATALAAKRRSSHKPRLVISEHSSLLTRLRSMDLRAWATMPFARYYYAQADAFVAVSDGVLQQIEALFPSWKGKIARIYNPVLDDWFYRRLNEETETDFCNIANTPTIISLSRMIPLKEHKLLVHAFHRLTLDDTFEANLVMIGDGPERKAIAALIETLGLSHRITLLGSKDNPLPYLRMADLFVHPARLEGFGNVIVEAMGAGVPVVATDCPSGPFEILEGGKWGILAKNLDAEDLSRAILEGLKNPIFATDACLERFKVSAIIDAYEGVLFP